MPSAVRVALLLTPVRQSAGRPVRPASSARHTQLGVSTATPPATATPANPPPVLAGEHSRHGTDASAKAGA